MPFIWSNESPLLRLLCLSAVVKIGSIIHQLLSETFHLVVICRFNAFTKQLFFKDEIVNCLGVQMQASMLT